MPASGQPSSRPSRRGTADGERRPSRPSTTAGGSRRKAPSSSRQRMARRLVDRVVRRLELPNERDARAGLLIDTEWIVTNGLGGYSSSTLAGVITRRYHGILVAALPNPLGRVVMLNHLGERLVAGERTASLNSSEGAGGPANVDAAG